MSILTDIGTKVGIKIKSILDRLDTLENSSTVLSDLPMGTLIAPSSYAVSSDRKVAFETSRDVQGGVTADTANDRLKVTQDGIYAISFAIGTSCTAVSAGDGVYFEVKKNGVKVSKIMNNFGSVVGQEMLHAFTTISPASENDYFELYVSNISAAEANFQTGTMSVYLLR